VKKQNTWTILDLEACLKDVHPENVCGTNTDRSSVQQVVVHQPWHQGGTENGHVADQELRIAVRGSASFGHITDVNIQYFLYFGWNAPMLS
jgi:hypothetical protein